MNTAPGWYPDPSDDRIMRFWDGTQWNAERSLSGTATVDDVPPAASGSTVVKTKISVPRLTRTGWFLFAGCAVAAVGTMLPWEQDTTPLGGQLTAGPSSVPGGVAMLLALLGLIVWIGWPARDGQLSKARCVGLTIVGALLMFFVFAKFAACRRAHHGRGRLSTCCHPTRRRGCRVTDSRGRGIWIPAPHRRTDEALSGHHRAR